MPTRTFHQLACPLDGLPLTRHDRQLLCPDGHSFDIARQGYANLLPVQHKKSRHPGDSQAMVEARVAFLDSGAYAPIAEQLAQSAAAVLPAQGEVCVLDGRGMSRGVTRTSLLVNRRVFAGSRVSSIVR